VTRWRRASTRRPRRGGQNGAVSSGKGRGARAKGRPAIAVDEYDNLILLRSSAGMPPRPDGVAELARFLGGDEGVRSVFTIVVGAEDADAELWTRLGAVLDSLRDRGVTTIRLALSGAGAERPGRPAVAQRIADAWGFEVVAPDASVLIVPGGSLFALGSEDTEGPDRGWRSFTSGAEPTSLGRRSPAPDWQPTFARLPRRTAGGYVVEQVPAGILLRSAKAPRTRSGDLCYAVPVDDAHPTVLVGTSQSRGGPDVPAEEIAALLAALPDTTRSEVRLAPCGAVDLLPIGQDTAEILGAEVEVLTGVPLVVGADTEPEVRPVLVGADTEPTWAPFVEAVACRPYDADGSATAPRVLRWRSPLSGIRRTDRAAVPLSDRWQVCVTRAGLAVGPRGEEPAVADRPVSAERLAVDVNLRGAPADDTLFAELSRLLSEIGAGVREFVTLHRALPPDHTGDEDFRLLRLAIEHGVSLAEQPSAEPAPPSATPNVRTVAIPRIRPPSEPAAAPTAHRPGAAGGLPAAVPARFTARAPGGSVPPAGAPAGPKPDAPMGPVPGGPRPGGSSRDGSGSRGSGGPALSRGGAPGVSPEGGSLASGSGGPAEAGSGTPEAPMGSGPVHPAAPAGSGAPTDRDSAEAVGRGPAHEPEIASRGPGSEDSGSPAASANPAAGGPPQAPGVPFSPGGAASLPPSLGRIPLTPVTPSDPLTPSDAATPSDPARSSDPATRSDAATSSDPATPESVSPGAEGALSATPSAPSTPAGPGAPAGPAALGRPVAPAGPGASAGSGAQADPGVSAGSAESAARREAAASAQVPSPAASPSTAANPIAPTPITSSPTASSAGSAGPVPGPSSGSAEPPPSTSSKPVVPQAGSGPGSPAGSSAAGAPPNSPAPPSSSAPAPPSPSAPAPAPASPTSPAPAAPTAKSSTPATPSATSSMPATPSATPSATTSADSYTTATPSAPSPASAAGVRPGTGPAAPGPRPAAKPVRRSTEAERTEFRAFAQPVWEGHSASVNRAMTRMPALRGPQLDAARADLVAVHVYLSGGLDDLGRRNAAGGVPAGYTACLRSGLGRLPSYRGAAVRGGLSAGDLERFMPGAVLRESGPVSALPIGAAGGLPGTAGGYAIWSSTGRRVRPLLGSAPGAASDEVVFPPGAVFRVLDVRSAGPAPTVLLVEVVGGGAAVDDRPGGLSDADRAALERLDEALRRQASLDAGAAPASWPARCAVPLGGRAGAA
jgi:hypothetical protein